LNQSLHFVLLRLARETELERPHDALFCTARLLDRVEEGSAEVEAAVAAGAYGAAARRARDDLVRLCTAALLLEGVTRPRTAECVLCFAGRHGPPRELVPVLRWAAESFGADGKDHGGAIAPPPGGPGAAARAVEALRRRVVALRRALAEALGAAG